MEEVWKPVKGWEKYYEVSSKGRLRSLDRKVKSSYGSFRIHKGKILKQKINKFGYKSVTLQVGKNKKTLLMHRLVALAFLANNKNKPCVNHKDLNKQNNTLDNLEWCTYKENRNHAEKNGVYSEPWKCTNNATLKEEDVRLIRKLYKDGVRIVDLVKRFKVTHPTISRIVHEKSWRYIL